MALTKTIFASAHSFVWRMALLVLASVLFVSCQTTNFSDLIDYRRLDSDRAAALEKKVTLRFDRKSLILDGEDNTVKTKTIGKGTKVTVLGLRHEIGRKKSVPHFTGENPEEVVTWLVRLPDGSRAYMEVPEMANVMEGASIRDVAIYYPTRHFKPFVGDMKFEDCTKWWSKVLFRLGGPIDFLSSHKARHLLYKDGAFYSYRPLIAMPSDTVAAIVQAILSSIFLFFVLIFAVQWLAVRAVWRLPWLPNVLIKFLVYVVAALLFIVFAVFLGVEAWGYVIWPLIAIGAYSSYVPLEIDYNRCPYCHKIGLSYENTVKGEWSSGKKSERKETVETGRETREYDTHNGIETVHVKETIIHQQTNRYIDTWRSRKVITHLNCHNCGRTVSLVDIESEVSETKQI